MTYTIRPAAAADVPALAALHRAGWRAAYEPLVDPTYFAAQDHEAFAVNWRQWIADAALSTLIAHDEDSEAAGLISYGGLKTPPPGSSPIRPLYTAEIYALFVDPQKWGGGCGRALMAAATADLRARKHKSLCLWVIEGNKGALAFYKKLGGQRCGKMSVEVGNRKMQDIAIGWRDSAALLSPQDGGGG